VHNILEKLYNPEIIDKGDEEVWRALIDGQGVVRNFVSAEIAKEFGDRLDLLITDEDRVGIVLNTSDTDWSNDPFRLSPEDKKLLRSIELLFAALIARAADLDEDEVIAGVSEVLKYIRQGQDWHTDNYEEDVSQPNYLKSMSVINGILTLKGRAIYRYKDPATSKVETIEASPGTLVLTRSGDIDGLPQIEHSVDAPLSDETGKPENRLVLLFSAPGKIS